MKTLKDIWNETYQIIKTTQINNDEGEKYSCEEIYAIKELRYSDFMSIREEAKKWIEELEKEFEESIRLKHINSICAISAKVEWIKMFFNLEDEKNE